MSGREVTRTALARLGFSDLIAVPELLASAGSVWGPVLTQHIDEFAAAANPDQALSAIVGLAVRHSDDLERVFSAPQSRAVVIALTGVSTGFVDFFDRHPGSLVSVVARPLVYPSSERVYQEMAEAVRGVTGDQAVAALRVRYRELLAWVAAVDVLAASPLASQPGASRALADLAGAAVDAALTVARSQIQDSGQVRASPAQIDATRLAVIGMGKTGAGELNYVSDVDVIFVADSADQEVASTDQAIAIATRLATLTMRAIDGIAVEPPLWEVDANLRPEGRKGALVRTLASHIAYYERWAKGWEFQALVKARPIAGDRELGARYRKAIDPFIWRIAANPEFVASVRSMRERVTDHIPAADLDSQVKLGPGGIRDVEFTVQLLQLVHGQHDERIHQAGTLDALAALAEFGYVGRADAAEFSECYRVLRVIEHRLQLRHLRRTHVIPSDADERRLVARATRVVTNADELEKLWHTTRSRVRSLHERIFYRPLLDAVARLPEEEVVLSSEQAAARLAALGFRNPQGVLSHIGALTSGVSRKAEIQRLLMPVMLNWFAEGTDPDYGILAFRRISENLGDTHWFLRTLRDSSGAAERLTKVLSSSRFAGDLLDRSPESTAWFGDEAELSPRGEAELSAETVAIARRHGEAPKEAAKRVLAVRRRETLRLAIASILGLIDESALGIGLSAVAASVLRAMVAVIDPERRFGIEFGVVAMGRFGGGELGFSSDIDVIYVFRPLPGTDPESAERGARAVSTELTELTADFQLPFEIDLGLRPEGKNGPPARTLDAYAAYYARWSAIWEAQALLRAAPIAGSEALLTDMMALVDSVRYPASIDELAVREIRRIKARVESERLPRGADPRRHLKLGRGSLSDVEWLVQLRQLQHAHAVSGLRTTSTRAALDSLSAEGLLPVDAAETLRAAWLLASRVRSASTLYRGSAIDELPTDFLTLDGIARLLGYAAGSAVSFENDYLRVTRRARAVFEREFYGE